MCLTAVAAIYFLQIKNIRSVYQMQYNDTNLILSQLHLNQIKRKIA